MRTFSVIALSMLLITGSVRSDEAPATKPAGFDDALRRLHEKEEQRKRAATQPATQPTPHLSTAVDAIQSLASDLNDVMARKDADAATVAACFGNLRGNAFSYTGIVFGVTSEDPMEPFPATRLSRSKRLRPVPPLNPPNPKPGVEYILVRFTLPVERSSDQLWRDQLRSVESYWDDQIKQLQDRHNLQTKYTATDSSENYYQTELKGLKKQRADAVKSETVNRPTAPIVDLYLAASKDVILATKKGQTIRGQINFVDGQAKPVDWMNRRGQAVEYAGEIHLVAEFQPEAPAAAK